jgi:hypothetical protein
MSRLQPGKYRARGRWAKLAYTKDNNPQVAAELEIIDGGLHAGLHGHTLKWFGQFTEKTEERTLESLRLLGWDNDDLSNMSGIGTTDVEIVVGEEEYDGRRTLKVQWINALGGGGAALKAPMDDTAAANFARRMKAAAAASRAKLGSTLDLQRQNTAQARAADAVSGGGRNSGGHDAPPPTDDDIPFIVDETATRCHSDVGFGELWNPARKAVI